MLAAEMTDAELNAVKATIRFVGYCLEFYGKGGIYDMGATHRHVCDATKILLEQHGTNVAYDSIDRERVRDIMINEFNLVFPTPQPD